MAVESFDISRREPYADGQSFGKFGPFEIIEGRIRYAVDPAREPRIVDLHLAPRDADGLVRYSGDFTFIVPASESGASKLLIDVPNRGRRLAFSSFNRAGPDAQLEDPCAPGDGFLFRHGFALASIGWQWGAQAGLALDPPMALEDGRPIRGDVVYHMQPGLKRAFMGFVQPGETPYPPADLDAPGAMLFEREHDNAPLVPIDRERWRFARERDGRLEPSSEFIHLDGGFEPGRIYILVFETEGAPVIGTGLLALRDAAACLRRGDGPNGKPFDHVFAFGASQTGRVLRHLLYEGLNTDEHGMRVFDGMHIHIAGGQRGDFNHRFARPSSLGIPSAGQVFPFAGVRHQDPVTGQSDGLYEHVEHVPKIIITNTSWEYWRGDAALTHVRPDGGEDLSPHPRERNYLLAGTHHVNGVFPPTNQSVLTGEKTAHTFNVIDHGPLVRAALVNLAAWVAETQEPPPSAVPTLADGTLADRAAVMSKFQGVPGISLLDPAQLGGLSVLDLGPDLENGICRFPAIESTPYARLVCDVDESHNEVAGIRLPDLDAPVGFHTGWNPRHPDHGAPGQAATFMGTTHFGDVPWDAQEYEALVRELARDMVRQRTLLAEDVDLVVDLCMKRHRFAAQHAAASKAAG